MPSAQADQLVFGYRDGHELLASSTQLSSATEREILPHVDASFEDDSPHYLVGVPLRSIERYLLARIWPAPEVDRPGSVWTHALLLDTNAMEIGSAAFMTVLRRPSHATLEMFAGPTRLQQDVATGTVPDRLLTGLTWATLGAPDDRSVVLWGRLEEAEHALVRLLDALPAAARWRFALRTRGRARLGDANYDVQIATRLSGRSAGTDSKVLDLRRPTELNAPRWTQLTADSEAGKKLRRFLEDFSDDQVQSRSDVRGLLDVWTALKPPDPEQASRTLIAKFQDREALANLKAALFGNADRYKTIWRVPEADRLGTVVSHPDQFDWDALEVEDRLPKLLAPQPEAALRLAAQVFSSGRSEQNDVSVLDPFANAVRPADVPLAVKHRGLLLHVLQLNPQLLEHSASWAKLPIDIAIAALTDLPETADSGSIAQAPLKADRHDAWSAILRAGRLETASFVTSALRDDATEALLKEIEDADPGALGKWLADAQIEAAEAVKLASTLTNETLRGRPAERWLDAGAELHLTFTAEQTEASVSLLVLAFGEPGNSSDQLLRETFAPVHRALVEKRLSQAARARLDCVLPRSDKNGRPRRLRKALVERAEAAAWTEPEVAYAIEGAGAGGEPLTELVPKKDPIRRLLEAINRAADVLR